MKGRMAIPAVGGLLPGGGNVYGLVFGNQLDRLYFNPYRDSAIDLHSPPFHASLAFRQHGFQ